LSSHNPLPNIVKLESQKDVSRQVQATDRYRKCGNGTKSWKDSFRCHVLPCL